MVTVHRCTWLGCARPAISRDARYCPRHSSILRGARGRWYKGEVQRQCGTPGCNEPPAGNGIYCTECCTRLIHSGGGHKTARPISRIDAEQKARTPENDAAERAIREAKAAVARKYAHWEAINPSGFAISAPGW